ncbi:hypothetical protein GN958_ATG06357 [Phytophthora infestans]|uniref:Uncharacterized protein n=1 Tax=Phytophthora infestans TaxID=4787 RepID=A0A8S9UZW3_PHYIN|nr:hypothetical protein GN958_ATG06357 [Phytophthora infestans]
MSRRRPGPPVLQRSLQQHEPLSETPATLSPVRQTSSALNESTGVLWTPSSLPLTTQIAPTQPSGNLEPSYSWSPLKQHNRISSVYGSVVRNPSIQSTHVQLPESIAGASEEPFSWTVRAAEVLLKVRFRTMKHRFQGTKNSSQLKAAWIMLAAEVSKLGGG